MTKPRKSKRRLSKHWRMAAALLFSRGLKIPVYGEAAWKADTLRSVRTHGQ